MPHIMVETRHVGPIPFDGDKAKPLARYQLLRDALAHAVEFRGAVGRFSEQHDFRVADPLQQRVEVRRSDRVEGLARKR